MVQEIDVKDIPLSASWNFDGSQIVTSCKDKKVRIIDPRSGSTLKVIYNCNRNQEFIKRHLESEVLPTQASVFTDKKSGFQALAEQGRGMRREVRPNHCTLFRFL